MPFLLRIIAQRAVVAVGAMLTFFGLSPDVVIPTPEEVVVQVEERRENITEILTESVDAITPENLEKKVEDLLEHSIINQPQPIPAPEIVGPAQETTPSPIREPELPIKEIAEIVEDIKPKITEADLGSTEFRSIDDVLVNIICTHTDGNATTASTGSGVIISPDGVVVTNAHVAMMFLLQDYPRQNYMNCNIYKENIPTYGYKADLLYIQESWLRKNTDIIKNPSPRGTGEDDYALLHITRNTNPALSLPSRFPYAEVSLDEEIYEIGNKIIVGGFPGAPTSIFDLAKAGKLQKDSTYISDVFTFKHQAVDVFTTGETHVAARGASGGGHFHDNKLVGITVTTTGSGSQSKINALTTVYLNNDIRSDTRYGGILDLISNPSAKAEDFAGNTVPELAKMLEL